VEFDLILFGGQIVTSRGIRTADIGIKNGRISEVGDLEGRQTSDRRNVSAFHIFPGAIDTQVHFREPGLEHKEDIQTGSLAALHGGVTTFLEMPNTKPETISRDALSDKLQRAAGRAYVHYGFFVGASPSNAEELQHLENLPGTPGVKIFMGSSTGDLLVDKEEDLLRVLKSGKKRVAVHAENEARNVERKSLISSKPSAVEHAFLRDAESAKMATEQLIRLSKQTGRPVHILHISTADELPLIAAAKQEGLPVTCEVTPQHLWFVSPECYTRLGNKTQMNPPIRSAEHREGLWKALEADLFDVFGSDHAPHTLEEKNKAYPSSPSGMPGVETMLPILLTFASEGRLTLPKIVRMLCERPAELYGMQGKGKIEVGYDADLLLVLPEKSYILDESNLHSKCGWSPYHGEKLTGLIQSVFINGEIAKEGGVTIGDPKGKQIEFK
jgi:dihydroorotase